MGQCTGSKWVSEKTKGKNMHLSLIWKKERVVTGNCDYFGICLELKKYTDRLKLKGPGDVHTTGKLQQHYQCQCHLVTINAAPLPVSRDVHMQTCSVNLRGRWINVNLTKFKNTELHRKNVWQLHSNTYRMKSSQYKYMPDSRLLAYYIYIPFLTRSVRKIQSWTHPRT